MEHRVKQVAQENWLCVDVVVVVVVVAVDSSSLIEGKDRVVIHGMVGDDGRGDVVDDDGI